MTDVWHIVTRRDFLRQAWRWGVAAGGAGVALSSPAWLKWLNRQENGKAHAANVAEELARNAPRARFWIAADQQGARCLECHPPNAQECHHPETGELLTEHTHANAYVKCLLCAQTCLIPNGERGGCRARMNVGGELRSLVYGRPISIHVDPIEKKPFYHFLPGSSAYSLATAGCPLHCKFCQNWELSQSRPEDHQTDFVSPDRIVSGAQSCLSPVIAFTYNEPTVFTEYLLDIAARGREAGVRSVLISCGFMTEAPLTEMCQALDAIKIDLKGFSPDFYHNVCSADLQPVLRSIKQVARSGVHLEIVNLVVPTLNDSDPMMRGLVDWVMGEIGPDVPVHFTRFHPDYQLMNLPPTPVATLEKVRDMAMESGIHYAFVGNVPGHPGNNTYCPSCHKAVIKRSNFFVVENNMKNGKCGFCGTPIAGVWQ
jgi:pyruvate formate lyase activating enzyme